VCWALGVGYGTGCRVQDRVKGAGCRRKGPVTGYGGIASSLKVLKVEVWSKWRS